MYHPNWDCPERKRGTINNCFGLKIMLGKLRCVVILQRTEPMKQTKKTNQMKTNKKTQSVGWPAPCGLWGWLKRWLGQHHISLEFQVKCIGKLPDGGRHYHWKIGSEPRKPGWQRNCKWRTRWLSATTKTRLTESPETWRDCWLLQLDSHPITLIHTRLPRL